MKKKDVDKLLGKISLLILGCTLFGCLLFWSTAKAEAKCCHGDFKCKNVL
jgi:hypothetical protein